MKEIATTALFLYLITVPHAAQANKNADKDLLAQAKEWKQSPGFLENNGQMTDPEGNPVNDVLFRLQGMGTDIYVTTQGLSYVFIESEEEREKQEVKPISESKNKIIHWSRVDMELTGARIIKENITREYPSAFFRNYYLPHCPNGIRNVHEYGKITIHNIYPGIDWVFHCNPEGIKYDFIVHPGANPKDISWRYRWAKEVNLETDGEILITGPAGNIREGRPKIFQGDQIISGGYKSYGENFRFEIASYDQNEILVIDPVSVPVLTWGTYIGGSALDGFCSIDADANGNVFVTGYQFSSTYPTYNPGGNAYFQGSSGGGGEIVVLKFSNAGAMLWCTQYGGLSNDWGASVVVDPVGNIFVTGMTMSGNLPTQLVAGSYFQGTSGGGTYDGFILKFDNAGVRQWATYYGGGGIDAGLSLTTNAAGDLYMAGTTNSTNIATVNPAGGAYFQGTNAGGFDVFILKFTNAGVHQWGTYYGGSDDEGGTSNAYLATAIGADAAGNIFVTGYTSSANFPTFNPGGGAYFQPANSGNGDAFILKFTNTGSNAWATYFGGTSVEGWVPGGIACSLDIDANGNLVMTGLTNSTNFPTLNPGGGAYFQPANAGGHDLFISKFTNAGVQTWTTYFGGSGNDGFFTQFRDQELTIDPASNEIFITGGTFSSDFPTLNPGGGAFYDGVIGPGGNTDGYFLGFSPGGVLQWSTFNGTQQMDFGSALVVYDDCIFAVGEWQWSGQPGLANPGGGAYYDGTANGSDESFIMKLCSTCLLPTIATSQSNVTCNGGTDGSGTVNVTGGTAPFTFSWSPSGGNAATANNLGAGTYTVLITDASGCPFSTTITITQPALLAPNISGTNTTCGNSTGTASVSPTGGTGAYTYLWSNGQTTQNLTGLGPGTFSVTVTDANGCATTASVTVANVNGPTVTALATSNVSCFGASDGTALANASNGTAPYTYLWSNSQTDSNAINLTAGVYTVTVTDNVGCTNTETITITEPPSLAVVPAQSDLTCNGANDGSATVSVTGGTPGYTYSWTSGGAVATENNLSPGNYTCTITDTNGCVITQSFVITAPPALNLASAYTDILCNGGSTGSATVNVSGGTPGYTYAWTSGGTGATENNLPAGNYTCTVTDSNGCTITQVFTLTQPPALTVSATATNSNCLNPTGTATANPAGGTGPFSYAWSDGQTSQTANTLAAGTYTVTVTDTNGCTQTATATVAYNNLPTTTILSQSDVLCNGGTTGTATAGATGGTGPYGYSWSNSQTGATATGLAAGTYTVTVTDANGCVTTQSVNITEPPAITIAVSSTLAGCTVNNGTATANPSGGVSPYTYNWSNSQTTQMATALSGGIYSVTITDSNGCTQTQTVTVNVDSSLALTLTSTQAGCTVNNGSATANPSGGVAPYTYSWSNSQVTQTATGLAAGTYTVTVTDANGCIQTQSVAVTINTTLALSVTSTLASCGVNDGTATGLPSGGVGPYSYSWSDGQTTPTATGLASGTYTLTVTDANGCIQTQLIAVNAAAGPVATAGPAISTITIGNSVQLSSTGGGTYQWSPATGLSCTNCPDPLASPGVTTVYCVTISDTGNCTDSACVVINVEIPCNGQLSETMLPNAFSPNNDGQNDQLCVPELPCLISMIFIIYDRWGEKVFETADTGRCWDGTYKGKELNAAVFVYEFEGVLSTRETVRQKGNISLIK